MGKGNFIGGVDKIRIMCYNEHMNIYSYVKEQTDMRNGTFSPTGEQIERIGYFFKVMGDPTRLKILTALLGGNLCVMHISEAVGMSQSAVSHQLAILRRAKLVRVLRSGKTQVYSIADEHVRLILDMALLHSDEV